MASNRRYPLKGPLHPEVKHDIWVTLDDPTCLEVDDWVYNPESCKCGRVILITESSVEVVWYKTNEIEFLSIDVLTNFWWADPVIQY